MQKSNRFKSILRARFARRRIPLKGKGNTKGKTLVVPLELL